jgi:hypothetical protein
VLLAKNIVFGNPTTAVVGKDVTQKVTGCPLQATQCPQKAGSDWSPTPVPDGIKVLVAPGGIAGP